MCFKSHKRPNKAWKVGDSSFLLSKNRENKLGEAARIHYVHLRSSHFLLSASLEKGSWSSGLEKPSAFGDAVLFCSCVHVSWSNLVRFDPVFFVVNNPSICSWAVDAKSLTAQANSSTEPNFSTNSSPVA